MQIVGLLLGVSLLGAILGGAAVLQMPAIQADGDTGTTAAGPAPPERIVPLRELLPPMRYGGVDLTPVTRVVIGGIIWNDAIEARGGRNAYALWDTGGNYDLFEGYFGIDDDRHRAWGTESATLVFVGDGQRLGSLTVHRGDKARFFACPMNHCRAFQLQLGASEPTEYRALIIANARLVSGRTKPSQPIDLIIDDGETKYIEQPGEYKFHVRMPR